MQDMVLHVNASLERVVHGEVAAWGFATYTVTDDDLMRLPAELRPELALWLERSSHAENDYGHVDEDLCLQLDVGRADFDAICAALRREHQAKVDAEVEEWLGKPDKEWIDDDIFGVELLEAVAKLEADPRIAQRLENVRELVKRQEKASEERSEAYKRAREGLRNYAREIPQYARAVAEDYDVSGAAARHYAEQLAEFDEDAEVLGADEAECKNAKFEERKAPDPHAFEVLDGVTAHIESVRKPEGVAVTVDRIQRYRRAYVDKKRWRLDSPVTVVRVVIQPRVVPPLHVLFFADAAERRQYFKQSEWGDDDIPF